MPASVLSPRMSRNQIPSSWRRTVLTLLENATVPELEAARLVGHKIQTMSYGIYSGGPDLTRLRDTVERIKHMGLKL